MWILINYNYVFFFCYIQTYFILTFYVVVMILYIIILIHYIHIFFFSVYTTTRVITSKPLLLLFSYFCLYSTHSTVLVLLPRVEFKFSVRPTSLFLFIKLHSLTSFFFLFTYIYNIYICIWKPKKFSVYCVGLFFRFSFHRTFVFFLFI